MKYLLWLLLFTNEMALACRAMNAQQLQAELSLEPAEQLVFFASWCATCKKHMTQEILAKSYFIAVFDDQSAAVKAYRRFLGESKLERCIWDRDGSIAKAYAVKSVPVIRSQLP